MKKLIVLTLAIGSLAGAALADGTLTGAAGGAVTGAVVGGPIGAAVGGVAGAIVGTAIDPPPAKVVTYVRKQPTPPATVLVEDPLTVGTVLPDGVVITSIPDDPHYGYVVVGEQRAIVQPKTRKVVQIVD